MKPSLPLSSHTFFQKGYSHNEFQLDEMCSANGIPYPQWQPLLDQLATWGNNELANRQHEIARQLKENGVTYNVYNDPQGGNRLWKLDMIPFLVAERDWKNIEEGLKQRAELFNLILEDIYGPQHLIREGVLPMELVYQHSGFLRPCFGVNQHITKQLSFYAIDVARGHDGRAWAISDRAQAPSGAGYALENRSVMGRTVPELLRQYPVKSLNSFFEYYRETLQSLSPRNQDEARIVILTPGPFNETYFEHAYLSSYMGYPLVHGSDLVVRDRHVWLKTVKGLERVDVIIRRVDAAFCDPLELYPHSYLGVAGLLEVVRQGNVALVNPLGSGVLENPAFNAFLANICRFFLQQDLRMPTIATWWCGQQKEMKYVLENIEKLIVKRIDRQYAGRTFFGKLLPKEELEELKKQILQYPHQFAAQEQVHISTSPTLIEGNLEPRHSVLRTFLVAHKGSYQLMPGGMTRTASTADSYFVSQQSGGISKDTWIVGEESEVNRGTSLNARVVVPKSSSGSLSSRTAENQFWMARYAIRVLETARLLRLIYHRLQERDMSNTPQEKSAFTNLLFALTHLTMTYPGFLDPKKQVSLLSSPSKELISLTSDPQRNGSLLFSLNSLSHAAMAVREMLSQDAWRLFDQLSNQSERLKKLAKQPINRYPKTLDKLVTQVLAFMGLNAETLSREQGVIVFKIGRRVEQALLTCSLLRANLVFRPDEATEYFLLEDLLSLNESLHTYRVRYRSGPAFSPVVHLLLLDPGNPRSICYHVRKLGELLDDLAGEPNSTPYLVNKKIYDLLLKTNLNDLEKVNPKKLIRENLEHTLSEVSQGMTEVAIALGNAYFNHSKPRHSL